MLKRLVIYSSEFVLIIKSKIFEKVMNISSSTWNTDGEGKDSDDCGRTLMFLLCHHFSINVI